MRSLAALAALAVLVVGIKVYRKVVFPEWSEIDREVANR